MLKKLRRRLAVIFTVLTGAVLTIALAVSTTQSATQIQQSGNALFMRTIERVVSTLVKSEDPPVALITGDIIVCVKQNGLLVEETAAIGAQQAGIAQAPAAYVTSVSVSLESKEALFEAAKAAAQEREPADDNTVLYSIVTYTGETPVEDSSGVGSMATEKISFAYVMDANYDFTLGDEDIFEVSSGGESYRAAYFTLRTNADAGYESIHMTHDLAGRQQVHIGDGPSFEAAILENLGEEKQQIVQDVLLHLLILLGGLAALFLANWALAGLVLRSTSEGLRRQTEFVAAASHELRSPLAVIRASLSAAKEARQDADEPQAEKFNDAAMGETERMGRLVDDLLLLAGGDAGSWQLNKSPVDLDTLLIDAVESYTPLAKAKGLRLELSLPDKTLPKPNGDAERLRQILAVLLDNALQYAPAGTAIQLAAEAKKGRVSISVADGGPGIPENEKERVFDRFYRADKSRHDKAHFGLGLAVARELAGLHGGKLVVADTQGGGATFTLTLPLG